MWPLLATVGGSLIGGFFQQQSANATNHANAQQVEQTNAFNAAEAAKNREFQERMSNTQYSRAVADMRAAGLNPALAYQQGGAGTPGGSSATGTAARMDNPGSVVASTLSTALETAQRMANLKQTEAAINKTTAEEDAVRQSTYRDATMLALDINSSKARYEKDLHEGRFLNMTLNDRAEAIRKATILNAAQARELGTRTELQSLSIPEARNNAARQNDAFKKYLSPYLNDAKGVMNILGPLIRP